MRLFITVANHSGIWFIRFVSKNYIHPWKNFTNKLYLVLHSHIHHFFEKKFRVKPNMAQSRPREQLIDPHHGHHGSQEGRTTRTRRAGALLARTGAHALDLSCCCRQIDWGTAAHGLEPRRLVPCYPSGAGAGLQCRAVLCLDLD